MLFYPVHRALGGRLRLLISGGSALSPEIGKAFRGLGFRLFEGYGMTEASPVLTVQRPGDKLLIGSVGRALPGIDIKIEDEDDRGVGEVIARGPNVMKGYYEDEDETATVLAGGWLHTGDLGRLDESGNLYIVGRKKEMILGSSGENIYPDELEELYADCEYVKEVSIAGLATSGGSGETVAGLVVPDYEVDDLSRAEIRERVREHIKETSHKLPLYKRLRVYHLWDHDLPKTSTRKVKRGEVQRELERLEQAASRAQRVGAGGGGAAGASWVREVLGQVSQRPLSEVVPQARLDALGFDSLMITELAVALEAAGVPMPDSGELANLETVAEVEAFAGDRRRAAPKVAKPPVAVRAEADDDIDVPAPLARAGRRVLGAGMRVIYERLLDAKISGTAYVPPFGGYIVAANHASHLDMGLVKHALGENGGKLAALAAKDYFFADPIRRAYFENFTNLVPMERHGSLRESLRLAAQVVEEGYILLIFPEGTRSITGVMTDFKPSLGYLANRTRCGILPMFLAGTHDALPKGGWWLGAREVSARIGTFLSYDDLRAPAEGMSRSESYRAISNRVEGIVRGLCPEDQLWALGDSGRRTAVDAAAAADSSTGGDAGAPPATRPEART
nr:AMP-binding protein [uncultured Brevundimonas sp.]